MYIFSNLSILQCAYLFLGWEYYGFVCNTQPLQKFQSSYLYYPVVCVLAMNKIWVRSRSTWKTGPGVGSVWGSHMPDIHYYYQYSNSNSKGLLDHWYVFVPVYLLYPPKYYGFVIQTPPPPPDRPIDLASGEP